MFTHNEVPAHTNVHATLITHTDTHTQLHRFTLAFLISCQSGDGQTETCEYFSLSLCPGTLFNYSPYLEGIHSPSWQCVCVRDRERARKKGRGCVHADGEIKKGKREIHRDNSCVFACVHCQVFTCGRERKQREKTNNR